MFTRDNLYANLQSGHRIKGRRLPDVPTDEGVRKVITLHLNAQLVRRQQQAEHNKDNDDAQLQLQLSSSRGSLPPQSKTCWALLLMLVSSLDCWNRSHVTNEPNKLPGEPVSHLASVCAGS